MSFFNDIYECFKVTEPSKKITISLVLGEGAVAVGNFKIAAIEGDSIVIKSKAETATIFGESLILRSASRGELVVRGKITKIEVGGTK